MSVLGIGADLVAVSRIAEILGRHPERFLERCFNQRPPWSASDPARNRWVATRWAAKEAFLKSLGTEVRSIPYRDVEVVESAPGTVKLVLHRRALSAFRTVGGKRLHLAVSQEGSFALAAVIIET